MAAWVEPEPVHVSASLRDLVGGHPLVAEALVRRGVREPERAQAFLDPTFYESAPPSDLPDLNLAADRLERAVGQGERIAVWGDFDADGQTATALLMEVLQALGGDTVYHIPGRDQGHGVHRQGLVRLIAAGARLILTCDTGVTAHEAVAYARELGAEVIVTDHHVPGERLPPALAVINPHRLPQDHPMATLPGVGVAYQLARALSPALATRALDLVALGTVADVATLVGDTRYVVQRGLQALRQTERLGLRAVYEASGLNPAGITEEHIGYVLGPRLNALGRLDDAAKGVELLTTQDAVRARTLAAEVEGLNGRRQWLTKQVMDAALAQVQREPSLLSDHQALVLSHPTWPGGIVGIVAGRLAERFGKPVVLISAPQGKVARASGRSVPGVDLVAALDDCAHLLRGYGGHAGAAGFSIDAERISDLRTALSQAVANRFAAIPEPAHHIDAYVELTALSLGLVADINRLAPFGPGNPALTLAARDLTIKSDTTIGRTAEHRRIVVEDDLEHSQTVFWWNGSGYPLPQGRFDLAFTLRASDYRGVPEVQVEWVDARLQDAEAAEVRAPAPDIEVRDHRGADDPESVVHATMADQEVLVWAEANLPTTLEAHSRFDLHPAPVLVLWTLPPGPQELRAGLDQVQPHTILFFGLQPGVDEWRGFLTLLAGMAKFALRTREGWLHLEALAAKTAQRVSTICLGLECLAAQSRLRISTRKKDRWQVSLPASQALSELDPEVAELAAARLEAVLAETAAYREYLLQAPPEAILGDG
ncbi:MAG: single-stranded-DNA-specific exonuclease RecJ [Anaerolineae bacterium]|jgi:single-stranded-DNA-specific exonuclease